MTLQIYGWVMVATMTVVLLIPDFAIAAMFPDRIAPWVFIGLALSYPVFGCWMMLAR